MWETVHLRNEEEGLEDHPVPHGDGETQQVVQMSQETIISKCIRMATHKSNV